MAREIIRRIPWVLGGCVAVVVMAVAVACIIIGTDEKYNVRNRSRCVSYTNNVKPNGEEVRRTASRRVQVRHDDTVQTRAWKEANGFADVSAESFQRLSEKVTLEMSEAERAQMASDKNQVMDELLNRPEIPADYGMQMVALFRDGEQDVVTRDFVVQHIGLYAQALKCRGKYNPESPESASLRRALDEAARETKTIIAAAAFRALSDMSEFDPNIDGHRLDTRLVSCISDSSVSIAARVMAVQLCGERRIGSARSALAALAADAATPETLRRSAIHASVLIDGNSPVR